MIKLFWYAIIGYIIFKTYKIVKNMLNNSSSRNSDTNIFDKENVKSRINKKDAVDAEFEDISDSENPPSDQ